VILGLKSAAKPVGPKVGKHSRSDGKKMMIGDGKEEAGDKLSSSKLQKKHGSRGSNTWDLEGPEGGRRRSKEKAIFGNKGSQKGRYPLLGTEEEGDQNSDES